MKQGVKPFAQRLVSLLENDEDTFRILNEALSDLTKKIESYPSTGYGNVDTFKATKEKIKRISDNIRYLNIAIYRANRSLDVESFLKRIMKEDSIKAIS